MIDHCCVVLAEQTAEALKSTKNTSSEAIVVSNGSVAEDKEQNSLVDVARPTWS
jgi:hypothetical protein